MDKEFLKQYPTHLTQSLYQILDKIEVEEDTTIRSKLYAQLALQLERLKMELEKSPEALPVTEVVNRTDI